VAVADLLLLEAVAVRRLRVAALAYMRRTGAHDPGLLDASAGIIPVRLAQFAVAVDTPA
jgi:hypothetical protein